MLEVRSRMTRLRLRARAQRRQSTAVYGWDRLPRQLELIDIDASASESHTNAACGYKDIQAHPFTMKNPCLPASLLEHAFDSLTFDCPERSQHHLDLVIR